MKNFKKVVNVSGKYPKLKFAEGDLYGIDKEGDEFPVDILEDLYRVYKDDQIFSLSTKASKDEEIE